MKLKELVDIKVGLPLERKKAKALNQKGINYRTLTLKSFSDINKFDDLLNEDFIAESEIGSQYLTKENNVIVRLRAPNNAIFINSRNAGLIVPSLMAIITNIYPNILNSIYLTHFLNSQHAQNQYIKNTQGTSIQMIKIADLYELEISLPPLAEQTKIINYLDTANKEVNTLQQLIIEKHKLKTEVFEAFIKKNGDISI